MLKRILTWLPGVAGDDISDYLRKKLLLVQSSVNLDELDQPKRNSFLEEAHKLHKSDVLEQILNSIITSQIETTIKSAETQEQLWAGRANIAAMELLKEELKRYEALWQSEKEPEEFNPYDIT